MSQEPITHRNSMLRICVDNADALTIQGRAYGQRLSAPIQFTGMGNMLLQLERLMEAQNFPQAFQRIRTFTPVTTPTGYVPGYLPDDAMTEDEVSAQSGRLCTFILHVLTRQSATWQGSVDWLDGDEPQSFVSDLELLGLVDAKLSP